MTKELIDLDVDEVSLVDKGANRKRFLIVKHEDGGETVNPEEKANTEWLEAEGIVKYLETESVYKWLDAEATISWLTAEWLEMEKAFAPAVPGAPVAPAAPAASSLPADVATTLKSIIGALQKLVVGKEEESPDSDEEPAEKGDLAEKVDEMGKAVTGLAEIVEKIVSKTPTRKSMEGQDEVVKSEDTWPGFHLPTR